MSSSTLVLLALVGCAHESTCDTACGGADDTNVGDTSDTNTGETDDSSGGETDSGETGGEIPTIELLEAVAGSCSATTCSWTAEAKGTLGRVELALAATGDEGSVQIWEERHDAFSYTGESTYGGDTFTIQLALLDNFMEQEDNVSTLFDLNDVVTASQMTVMFKAYDGFGDFADCAVYGEDPSYFITECTNDWS